MATKAQKALDLIKKDGISVYEAAKRLDIPATTIYSAKVRMEHKQLKGFVPCPTCGTQVLPKQIKKVNKAK